MPKSWQDDPVVVAEVTPEFRVAVWRTRITSARRVREMPCARRGHRNEAFDVVSDQLVRLPRRVVVQRELRQHMLRVY